MTQESNHSSDVLDRVERLISSHGQVNLKKGISSTCSFQINSFETFSFVCFGFSGFFCSTAP